MKQLNQYQKIILYVFAAVVAIILFIHNPTGGYVNTKYTAPEQEMDYKNNKYIVRENGNNCRDEYKLSEWPGLRGHEEKVCEYEVSIMYWQSQSAIIWWFGKVINVLWSIAFATIIFSIPFFALKDKSA